MNHSKVNKITADAIFKGKGEIDTESVLIYDNHGKILDIQPIASHESSSIRKESGILCPGFVNSHCHLELSHLKGIIKENTGLPEFLKEIIALRVSDEETILNAIEEYDKQMFEDGISAVGDISNSSITVEQKAQSLITYHTFVECLGGGLVPELADNLIDKTKLIFEQFADKDLASSIVPHAPYTTSARLMGKICQLNAVHGSPPISIHMQETRDEDLFFINGSGAFQDFYEFIGRDLSFYSPPGKSSLQHILGKSEYVGKFLMVHNTFADLKSIEYASNCAPDIFWCLCPNANKYIENRLPNIPLFQKQTERITIGTDSLASNWKLSILEELRTINEFYPLIPLAELLQWSTSNGAEFLELNDRFGKLSPGFKPGIILLKGIDLIQNLIQPQAKTVRII